MNEYGRKGISHHAADQNAASKPDDTEVGLEACGSAHHWARELVKLGHDARMMPPAYVKPYIRRQKNDASDAAAICEAVRRPSMRFVGVRSLKNQAALMRHKAREMLVLQRTQLLNGLRGHLTEIGVIAAQGPRQARELAALIEGCDETIPLEVCEAVAPSRHDNALVRHSSDSAPLLVGVARAHGVAAIIEENPGQERRRVHLVPGALRKNGRVLSVRLEAGRITLCSSKTRSPSSPAVRAASARRLPSALPAMAPM